MCQLEIVKSPHFIRYVYYCFQFLLFGFIIIGVGPMLPYYAVRQHHPQTSYSVLFFGRSFGYIAGSLSIKFFEKKFTIHQCLVVGLLFAGIFHILFNYTPIIWLKVVFYFFGSFGLAFIDIVSSVATMQCFKNKEYESYLQFLYGFMALGGLIVPAIVALISYQTYLVLGIFALLLVPVGLFLQSPEIYNEKHGIVEDEQIKKVDPKQPPMLTKKLLILLCVAMLFVFSIQGVYNPWIASYAVLEHFNTKQNAVMYNSIFWATNTVFRFVYAFLGGKQSTRISIVTILGFFSSIGVIAIIYGGNSHVGLIFIAIMVGICEGPLLASHFGLAREYGYTLPGYKITTLMIFGSLGSGVFSFVTGKLMGIMAREILFIMLAFVFFAIFVMNLIIKTQMDIRDPDQNQLMEEQEIK